MFPVHYWFTLFKNRKKKRIRLLEKKYDIYVYLNIVPFLILYILFNFSLTFPKRYQNWKFFANCKKCIRAFFFLWGHHLFHIVWINVQHTYIHLISRSIMILYNRFYIFKKKLKLQWILVKWLWYYREKEMNNVRY